MDRYVPSYQQEQIIDDIYCVSDNILLLSFQPQRDEGVTSSQPQYPHPLDTAHHEAGSFMIGTCFNSYYSGMLLSLVVVGMQSATKGLRIFCNLKSFQVTRIQRYTIICMSGLGCSSLETKMRPENYFH